jgi:hypothetical protein
MPLPQMRLATCVALTARFAASDNCIHPGDSSWLDCIKDAGEYHLPAGTYVLDRHFQMPDGVTILGAGPGETIIQASHAVENGCGSKIPSHEYPGDPTTRIGFVLGNNCRIGGFTFLGKDDHRWQNYYGAALCGGAVFETPGCADAYCAGENIGEGHGDGGVENIVIEDVVISGTTADTAPQLAVFITQTKDLDNPTDGVHVKGVRMDHSWCDGINLHGAVRNAVVEDCDLSWQGDDNLAVWSAGDRADNITFRNNVVSQAKTTNLPSTRWGNCVALYGGSRITVSNTTCYHSSNAGVKIDESFKGSFGENTNIQVHDIFTDEGVPACQGASSARAACEEAKPVADQLPGWVKHSNTNCYSKHGATVVAPDSYWSTDPISPVACMAGCAAHAAASTRGRTPCTAVVTTGEGHCYFRTDINLDLCDSNIDEMYGSFDVWMSPDSPAPAPTSTAAPETTAAPTSTAAPASTPAPAPVPAGGWTKHARTNCYPGHGAEIEADWKDPCNTDISLESCRGLCMMDERCSGIAFRHHFSHGPCFLRSNIVLGQCVDNEDWDVWEKTPSRTYEVVV